MVFKYLFQSVTVSGGFGKTGSNHTSILLTCRAIYQDATPLLAPNVSFYFRSTEEMLDCLTTLSPTLIRAIRHVRVKSYPMTFYNPFHDRHNYPSWFFFAALPILPGLQLDRLVVEDSYHGDSCVGYSGSGGNAEAYHDVQQLVWTNGWKELHYISPTTEFLSSLPVVGKERYLQPVNWNKMLRERDGRSSGAFATAYVAKKPNVPGATENSNSRILYTNTSDYLMASHPAAIANVLPMDDSTSHQREVLIVLKRGKGVAYEQDGSTITKSIQNLLRRMTWRELKESVVYSKLNNKPRD